MLKNITTRYYLALSLLFSTLAPALHAFEIPLLSLPDVSSITISKEHQENAVLAAKAILLLSLLRLYTKKPVSHIKAPQEDSILDQIRYFIDEVWIGQFKKPKELKSINVKTGEAIYEKFEASGILGSLACPYKDIILPLIIFMSTSKKFFKDALQGINDWKEPAITIAK